MCRLKHGQSSSHPEHSVSDAFLPWVLTITVLVELLLRLDHDPVAASIDDIFPIVDFLYLLLDSLCASNVVVPNGAKLGDSRLSLL